MKTIFDLVSGWGSPFAAVGAGCAAVLLVLRVFPGVIGVVKSQRETIQALEDDAKRKEKDAIDLKLHHTTELAACKAKIIELEGTIAGTRDLTPLIEVVTAHNLQLAAHEERAAERHDASMAARSAENHKTLGLLQLIADNMPKERNGHQS